MTQAVGRRSFTAETWVLLWATCETCGEQSVNGTGLTPSTWVFSVSIIPPQYHTHRQLTTFYTCQKNIRLLTKPGILHTKHSVSDMWEHWTENYCHIMFVVCQLRAKAVERIEYF